MFGELLFLLEYRDDAGAARCTGPTTPFELPKNLWFIGTMNTADRSIALVDAALRRRFHFVPFFPNDGPMEGLLERWLDAHDEPAWVGELVAMVNDELSEALGGPHLQIGPSYFMKHGTRRASGCAGSGTYNIEPFIEDQFFGDAGQIERFRFDAVLRRYRGSVGWARPRQLAACRHAEPGTAAERRRSASTAEPTTDLIELPARRVRVDPRVRLTDSQARRLAATGACSVTVAPDPEPGWWLVTAQEITSASLVVDDAAVADPAEDPAGEPVPAARGGAARVGVAARGVRLRHRRRPAPVGDRLLRPHRRDDAWPGASCGRTGSSRSAWWRCGADSTSPPRSPRRASPCPIACRFDDYTPDIAENRYLKAAVRRASACRRGCRLTDRRRLLAAPRRARGRRRRRRRSPTTSTASPITRLNAHYEPALRLARLLLDNLTLVDQRGGTTGVVVPGRHEQAVRAVRHRATAARAARAARGAWPVAVRTWPRAVRCGCAPTSSSAAAARRLRRRHQVQAHRRRPCARTADYYQLLAYTTALDLPEGVLIYCLADGGQPDTVGHRPPRRQGAPHPGRRPHRHAWRRSPMRSCRCRTGLSSDHAHTPSQVRWRERHDDRDSLDWWGLDCRASDPALRFGWRFSPWLASTPMTACGKTPGSSMTSSQEGGEAPARDGPR